MSLAEAVARLAHEAAEFPAGEVWLAGAGPGSLGCLTLDVIAAIAAADAIVYDALVAPAALRAARPGVELHYVGKRAGEPSASQADINALLLRLAGAGKRVLRLKGGDPLVFGRAGEEALELACHGVPFRFLPGITSAFGALAEAGIPATMRGVNKAIILATGHSAESSDDPDWAALARTGQPIVIYMGMNNLGRIVAALLGGGLAPQTPAAVLMAATTADRQVVVADLGTVEAKARESGLRSPALIAVGGIVGLRSQLQGHDQ